MIETVYFTYGDWTKPWAILEANPSPFLPVHYICFFALLGGLEHLVFHHPVAQ